MTAPQPDDEHREVDSSPSVGDLLDGETVTDPAVVAQIEREAADAHIRRAPRYGRFITVGTLVGVIAGIMLTVVARLVTGNYANFGAVTFFTALGLGTLGALVCGIIAVRQDRRSVTDAHLSQFGSDVKQ